jgi:hypothetical protein
MHDLCGTHTRLWEHLTAHSKGTRAPGLAALKAHSRSSGTRASAAVRRSSGAPPATTWCGRVEWRRARVQAATARCVELAGCRRVRLQAHALRIARQTAHTHTHTHTQIHTLWRTTAPTCRSGNLYSRRPASSTKGSPLKRMSAGSTNDSSSYFSAPGGNAPPRPRLRTAARACACACACVCVCVGWGGRQLALAPRWQWQSQGFDDCHSGDSRDRRHAQAHRLLHTRQPGLLDELTAGVAGPGRAPSPRQTARPPGAGCAHPARASGAPAVCARVCVRVCVCVCGWMHVVVGRLMLLRRVRPQQHF